MRKVMLLVLTLLVSASAMPVDAQLREILRGARDLARDAKDTVRTVQSLSSVSFGDTRAARNTAAQTDDEDGGGYVPYGSTGGSGASAAGVSGAGAALDSGSQVFFYSASWCKFCDRARSHMQARQVAFVEKDIESDPNNRAEYDRLRTRGVPVLLFGTKTMSGFSAAHFDQAYSDFQARLGGGAGTAASAAPAAAPAEVRRAEGVAFQAGDALTSKIAGIKLMSDPSRTAPVVAALSKSQSIVYLGEERNGFLKVATDAGDGWIDRLLVK